jgi:hypothetical protein
MGRSERPTLKSPWHGPCQKARKFARGLCHFHDERLLQPMDNTNMAEPHLIVRRMTLADAAALAQAMSEPAVYRQLMQLPYPNEELWHTRLSARPPWAGDGLRLVAELDGQPAWPAA